MARLKRRGDGELIIQSSFTVQGRTLHCTFQIEDQGVELLSRSGVEEDQHVPDELFFRLHQAGLLYTSRTGPGEEPNNDQRFWWRDRKRETISAATRRQIPTRLTDELLEPDGSLISFGAFKVRYGGARGYSDDILRPAYHEFEKEYERRVETAFAEILNTHRPVTINKADDRVIVSFLKRTEPSSGPPTSESDYTIREAERRDRNRRESLRSRVDPMNKPGLSGGYQTTSMP